MCELLSLYNRSGLGKGLGQTEVQNLTGGPIQFWLDIECWVK